MIDRHNVPDVEPAEVLARFILSSKHIRRSDDTIRPEAFIPHRHTELSVTRHRDATEDELWTTGAAIARCQQRSLHGRGDVGASVFLSQDLTIQAAPVFLHPTIPDNPNHANVTGWPKDDKARQRLLALEIASRAQLVQPDGGPLHQ